MPSVALRRPTLTFLLLERPAGLRHLEPGVYGGSLQAGEVIAPCTLRLWPGGELWCQPRGPLPELRPSDPVRLRLG
jgi:hypothetical protein